MPRRRFNNEDERRLAAAEKSRRYYHEHRETILKKARDKRLAAARLRYFPIGIVNEDELLKVGRPSKAIIELIKLSSSISEPDEYSTISEAYDEYVRDMT